MATLRIIPGSAAPPARTSMLGSFVAHTGLIALAVLGTQAPPPLPASIHETAIFLPVDPRPSRPVAPGLPAIPGIPGLTLPSALQLPTTIPLPDLVLPGWPPAPWTGDWPGAPGVPGDTTTGVPGTLGLPYDARVVEDPPVLVSHPAPRYPERLRQAGVEGEVVVEAVIDTLGRVEGSAVRIARSAHALMDAEALAVVRASQYRPGRMGARAVRVRILVPVRFALRR